MCSYGGENCSELSSPYVHMIALQVHVPIYKLFPGPFEDVEARIHAMQLKVPQSEHEGDPDPLDGTPIHHLNTSVKTSDHSLDLYEVLGHKDRDAALASLGLKKLPRDRPNMYVLGLWFPIGNTIGAFFFFSDFNIKIPLHEPIAIVWSSSFTHGSVGGPGCKEDSELVGTTLDVSQRTMEYLLKHRSVVLE